jgi:hypothetical protein
VKGLVQGEENANAGRGCEPRRTGREAKEKDRR